jgi:hypothetical protein
MFKILGIVLGFYTLYALIQGEVYTKSGAWGRTVSRVGSPEYFWLVITIYFALSGALITLF